MEDHERLSIGRLQAKLSMIYYDLQNTTALRRSLEPAQYLSIRYTERLAEAGIEPSVGSTGDSYDNALAESVIGLYKTEEIYRRGPWKGVEDVEFATLEWVAWYNTRRLLEPLGYVSPDEFEQASLSFGRAGDTHVTGSPRNPARFRYSTRSTARDWRCR